jgi:hypothetical protein
MTDLEKAYLLGYRDGYNRAMATRRIAAHFARLPELLRKP